MTSRWPPPPRRRCCRRHWSSLRPRQTHPQNRSTGPSVRPSASIRQTTGEGGISFLLSALVLIPLKKLHFQLPQDAKGWTRAQVQHQFKKIRGTGGPGTSSCHSILIQSLIPHVRLLWLNHMCKTRPICTAVLTYQSSNFL